MTIFCEEYLKTISTAIENVSRPQIDNILNGLVSLREQGGRLAVLGVGGSAGNASHFVNDLRKLAKIDAYCPTDNVSELTARTNDDGFETIFVEWLKTSHWSCNDAIFVLSVGGGSITPPVSINLVKAIDYARNIHAKVYGIVGRSEGHAAQYGDAVVVIPNVAPKLITPITEAMQGVIWHGLISHPKLQVMTTKW